MRGATQGFGRRASCVVLLGAAATLACTGTPAPTQVKPGVNKRADSVVATPKVEPAPAPAPEPVKAPPAPPKYDESLKRKACALLPASLLAEHAGVAEAELTQRDEKGMCFYSWAGGKASLMHLAIYESASEARKYFDETFAVTADGKRGAAHYVAVSGLADRAVFADTRRELKSSGAPRIDFDNEVHALVGNFKFTSSLKFAGEPTLHQAENVALAKAIVAALPKP